MLVALILIPVALDVIDRGILDPQAQTAPAIRYGWYAFVVVAPIVFSVLQYQVGFDGLLGEALRYAVRVAEAFLCVLLVQLYFTVVHRRTGRTGPERAATPEAALSGGR
jgi:hypothetical protein